MAARSIASLSLGFGLVSIPVKLYSATESSGTVRFNLLAKDGSRVKQQYVSKKNPTTVVPRAETVKGYEFEKDRYVLFTAEELKSLEEGASHAIEIEVEIEIEIVSFIPEKAVDPIYYDKAYSLASDKRGAKAYSLLRAAMQQSGRCALAKWAWKGKQYVVQVRAAEDGLMLQQLLYADEVRPLKELEIERVEPSDAEVQLALQLIDQIAQDSYDPTQYVDEEQQRILAAIDAKIAGKQVVAAEERESDAGGGQIIDLTEMLRANLARGGQRTARGSAEKVTPLAAKERKGVKRASAKTPEVAAPARARSRK